MDALERYASRHAEATIDLARHVNGQFRRVLVVPIRDEESAFWERLTQAVPQDVLIVLVVNDDDECDSRTRRRNAEVLERVGRHVFGHVDGRARVVLDATASGTPLPVGAGVGLARRLGFDLSFGLWRNGSLREPWIHTSDADSTPPSEVFGVSPDEEVVAMTFPFWHQPSGDPEVDLATAHYELWLRYYAAGLRWAGSPWGFVPLGSALAVRASAYAQVGGMPRRAGAEDFYVLAKLAKLGVVLQPDVPPVQIRSRLSARVPFGTGPGVRRRMELLANGEPPRLYDPDIFVQLREVVAAIDAGEPPSHPVWARVGGNNGVAFATKSARTAAQVRRRTHEWFGPLRTLKFVRGLEADEPALPWHEAVGRAEFCPETLDLHTLRRGLAVAPGTTFGSTLK